MRILSLSGLLSGTQSTSMRVKQIATQLISTGHKVDLVQIGSKSTYERIFRQDMDIEGINNSIVIKTLKIFMLSKVSSLLSRNRYDIALGNTHYGALYLTLCAFHKIPILFDMHGGITEEFLFENDIDHIRLSPHKLMIYTINRIIDTLDYHRASKIMCLSRSMINYLHQYRKVSYDKMFYFPNCIDLDFFQPLNETRSEEMRCKFGLQNKFIVGYVGDTQKWQGIQNLTEAMKYIKNDKVYCVIVGGNEIKHVDNILFLPRVQRNEVPLYYSLCDILVLPRSKHPAMYIAAPSKFIEYTAMAKPILTTDVGDAANFVENWNIGIVVSNNNPKNLANGINQFLEKTPDELNVMGKRARKCAQEEFDIKKYSGLLNEVIDGLVSRNVYENIDA